MSVLDYEGDASELRFTIKKIWDALGMTTYEQCKPFTIWEHVERIKSENARLLAANDELEKILRHISQTYCGIEVKDEITFDMVPAFVEGQIDKQSDRADKAEQLVCDFQAASMIDVGNQGGPCRVKPEHVEKHVIQQRDKIAELEKRVKELEAEEIRRIRHLNRLATWAQQDCTGPIIKDQIQEWVLGEIRASLGAAYKPTGWSPETVPNIMRGQT